MSTPNRDLLSAFAAGFELHPIQQRAAMATPNKWVDSFVTAIGNDGVIILTSLEDGSLTRVWHHLGLDLELGEPVAVHSVYGVLSRGGEYFSVAELSF